MEYLGFTVFAVCLLWGLPLLVYRLIKRSKKGIKLPLIVMAVALIGFIVAAATTPAPSYAGVEMKQEQIDTIKKLTDTEWDISYDTSKGAMHLYARDLRSLQKEYKKLTGKSFDRSAALDNMVNANLNRNEDDVEYLLGSGIFTWTNGDIAAKITGNTGGKDYKRIVKQMYDDYAK